MKSSILDLLRLPTKFSSKHFTKSIQICLFETEILFGLNMDKEGREQHRTNRQSRNERGRNNGSQQAGDNMALTFLRHLQSRFKP